MRALFISLAYHSLKIWLFVGQNRVVWYDISEAGIGSPRFTFCGNAVVLGVQGCLAPGTPFYISSFLGQCINTSASAAAAKVTSPESTWEAPRRVRVGTRKKK